MFIIFLLYNVKIEEKHLILGFIFYLFPHIFFLILHIEYKKIGIML